MQRHHAEYMVDAPREKVWRALHPPIPANAPRPRVIEYPGGRIEVLFEGDEAGQGLVRTCTFAVPKLVGGVKFEHTHRMIAQVAGLLTIVLAIWIWRAEKRHWMRVLGWGALGTVIAQGILGGLTVLFYLPPPISSAHAALAQTFFCITVAIAVFTGQKWVEEQLRVEFDTRRPSLFTLTLLSISSA